MPRAQPQDKVGKLVAGGGAVSITSLCIVIKEK